MVTWFDFSGGNPRHRGDVEEKPLREDKQTNKRRKQADYFTVMMATYEKKMQSV